MAPYETVEEYTRTINGYVEHVRIRRTDDAQYPSGWDYALHYGTIEGETFSGTTTLTSARKATNDTRLTALRRLTFPE